MWSDDEQGVRRKYPYRGHLSNSEGQAGPKDHVNRDRERHGEEDVDPEQNQDRSSKPSTCIVCPIFDDRDTYRPERNHKARDEEGLGGVHQGCSKGRWPAEEASEEHGPDDEIQNQVEKEDNQAHVVEPGGAVWHCPCGQHPHRKQSSLPVRVL